MYTVNCFWTVLKVVEPNPYTVDSKALETYWLSEDSEIPYKVACWNEPTNAYKQAKQ